MIMTITINNKEYTVKYNIRAMFIFEQVTGQSFKVQNLFDEYTLFYCSILAGTKDCDLKFDDFIDYCDENPDAFINFMKYLTNKIDMDKIFKQDDKKKLEEN